MRAFAWRERNAVFFPMDGFNFAYNEEVARALRCLCMKEQPNLPPSAPSFSI